MKRRNIKWIMGALAVGAAGVLLDALILEKFFFEVNTFNIGNRSSNKKLKLVLLTDLHLRYSLWPSHRRLALKINELQPDLILISGDTLDSSGNIQPMHEFFSLLHHHIPKVAIPGNHDHKAQASLKELKEVYAIHNCDFLVNESKAYTICDTRLMVTGLNDFMESEGNLRQAVKDVGREEHHILLIHSPLQQEPVQEEISKINSERNEAQRLNINYIFAGHNHGGQVRLPGYIPVLPHMSGGYVNGWYNSTAPFLYVSKGFGTSTIPVRFGARSEVTLFNYYV